MIILVINCGSSSIKYKLYDVGKHSLLAKGSIERIGEADSQVKDHSQGIQGILSQILSSGCLSSLSDISAVGHRVVHGGETFTEPTIIDASVLKKIKDCSRLAPLHNPANLAGIMGCKKLLPAMPQVAVFDTAFHQTMPPAAYNYAIPAKFYTKHKVRKYGFHGTSHQFVAQEAAKRLKKPLNKVKLITCHLGNGCSVAAIAKGRSLDTSMGFTPLEGLMMGTRCGDIDVAAVFYIMNKENISAPKMDGILNKESGFLGVSGISNDLRAVKIAMKKGNKQARLAYEMFLYRLKKYIGAYYFALKGVDAVCLTGGIGENNPEIINTIKKDIYSAYGNGVKVLVIPTDEELMIARLTRNLLRLKSEKGGVIKK
jgi:acetate kinase